MRTGFFLDENPGTKFLWHIYMYAYMQVALRKHPESNIDLTLCPYLVFPGSMLHYRGANAAQQYFSVALYNSTSA